MAGTDDGNRQVALTLDQVAVVLGLNPEQFEALDLKLGGIHGAVDKLAENISEPDTSVTAEVQSLKEAVSVGLADLRQSITDLNNTIHERSVDLAKWLAAIALAAANPNNNEAAVQAKIDEITASLNASAQEQEDALNQANQLKET